MENLEREIVARKLELHKDVFRRVERRAGAPEKYKCKICDLDFATSLAAMCAHAEQHRLSDCTRVYRVKKSDGFVLRPAEHRFNNHFGKVFPGSDAIFFKFVLTDFQFCGFQFCGFGFQFCGFGHVFKVILHCHVHFGISRFFDSRSKIH